MFNQAMALNQYRINVIKHYAKQAFLFLLLLLPLLGQEAFAAAGLTAAKTGLTNFLAEIQPIVRVVAVIGIVGGGLGYMFNFIDKTWAVRIIAGLIVIASANEIVSFFYTSGSVA